jgi:hypothetical protein
VALPSGRRETATNLTTGKPWTKWRLAGDLDAWRRPIPPANAPWCSAHMDHLHDGCGSHGPPPSHTGSRFGDGADTRARRRDEQGQGGLLLPAVAMVATSSAPGRRELLPVMVSPRRSHWGSGRGRSASIRGRAQAAPPHLRRRRGPCARRSRAAGARRRAGGASAQSSRRRSLRRR